MADEEWGEWQVHDGRGCPCVGEYVHAVAKGGGEKYGIAGSEGGRSWDFSQSLRPHIIRYRIRKPKGLTFLESLIADLPAPTNPKVDA